MTEFIDEARAYGLMEVAGLPVIRHGILDEASRPEDLPFRSGEPVVLKGLALGVWHKSEAGLVRFGVFDPAWILATAAAMRESAPGSWRGLLVAEKLDFARAPGLPSEALVALRRSSEAGWVAVMGLGGLQANTWGEAIQPLLWPLAVTEPEQALEELGHHLLGRIWLGRLRQGEALSTEGQLLDYLKALWRLAVVLEAEGLVLLEMNPVVITSSGRPMALDGVGQGGSRPTVRRGIPLPPEELHRILVEPRRVAVAGISGHAGSPGRVMLENLKRSTLESGSLIPIKPGESEILGLACVPGVEALRTAPVDQLLLALPASRALKVIEQLCEQGGGAGLVYLVSGGLGDGADASGRGARLDEMLARRRAEGLWTPVLAGPNGVGFLGCEGRLNATFISREKLPFEARSGPLALVSQSGAFLLACISKAPHLPLRYGVSIGNQLDLRLSDYLRALACDARIQVLACYVEGFRPGDLLEVVQIVKELKTAGKRLLLYKGGRSEAGQAAASSHTGALAGDWALQREVLCRAGAILASSVAEFDAAMAWLGAYPQGRPCQVAVLTNAGYEAVTSADLVEKGLRGYVLEADEQEALSACLAGHGLEDLVAPRVPLDLTPMAGERAFLDCTRLLAGSRADTAILGLVPFTQYLQTEDEAAMTAFAQELKFIADASGKYLAAAVDAGPEFEAYRRVLMQAGLPVFSSMERALLGLRLLTQ